MLRAILFRRPRAFSSVSEQTPPREWIEPFINLSDLSSSSGDPTPSPYLHSILSLILHSPPSNLSSNLSSFCRSNLIHLSPSFVSSALRHPSLRPSPSSALSFFRWASLQPRFLPSLPSFVSLIHLLSSSPDPSPIRDLISDLRHRDLPLTPSAASSLIKSLGVAGLLEELLWVLRRMKESGLHPTLLTHNCLLDALINSDFLSSAERVFDSMADAGIPPDVVSYNTLLKGYSRAGRTKMAVELLERMRAAGSGGS